MFIDKIYLFDDHMRIMMTYTGGPDGATDADEEDAEYYFAEAGSESEDSGVPMKQYKNFILYRGGMATRVWFDDLKKRP